jgi:poly(3-hydroxybutyrate) depolymerase
VNRLNKTLTAALSLAVLAALAPAPAAAHPTNTPLQPLLDRTLPAGGVDRQYSVYVPSRQPAYRVADPKDNPIVIVLHADGESARTYAERSHWSRVAEDEGFIVAFPSALDGRWNTRLDPARPDDVGFVTAVTDAVRSAYQGSSVNVYIAGEGTGAAVANEAAAINSPKYVAVASLTGGAPADFYTTAGTRLRTTTMASWTFTLGRPTGDEQRQIEYWKRANRVAHAARQEHPSGLRTSVYRNPADPLAQVRVTQVRNRSDLTGSRLIRTLWRDLFHPTLRFTDQDSINGHLVPFRTSQQLRLTQYNATIDGQPRRWQVYLPTNYHKLTAHGRKLPLVLAFHGRNGSGRYMAQQTEWHEVAEARGFIVVYPQAEPTTGPNIGFSFSTDPANADVTYTLALLNDVKTRFAVDTTRIIATGVSQGAAFTNRLAVQHPHLFAAIAPCYSGHLNASGYGDAIVRTDIPLPVWQCRGVNEVPTDYPGGTAGEAAARVFWRETVNHHSAPPTVQVDGRYTTDIYRDGLGEYRWTVTNDIGHFWPKDLGYKLWDEFLSRFRRLADGTVSATPVR